jgi:NAD(P)-dependent dehydrogenase (short-subunit alcohol dehydrogenase family)
MTLEVKNKVALVTGSNRGIGRTIVETLLERGAAKVYATARKPEALNDLVTKYGDRVVPMALDVTNEEQVTQAATQAGDVSILVNNAGRLSAAFDIFTEDLAPARQEFEVNYWGTFHVTRAFAPILKANGGGVIVNMDSIAGITNFPPLPTYSDSKAALHSLTGATRFHLADQGTLVVGVYPGPVDTDMAKAVEMEKASTESVANAILDGVESGKTDIFPDPMSENYAGPYDAGHKELERRTTEMLQPA